MEPETIHTLSIIGIALLFGLALGGVAWVFLRGFGEGLVNFSGAHSQETSRRMEDIFLFIPARRLVEISWAVAAVVFLLFTVPLVSLSDPLRTLLGLILGSIFASFALMLPGKIVTLLRNRRRRRFNLQLVDALASMSNALKAGFSINQAFETVVESGENPIAQEFNVFLQQMRVGMNFFDALQSLDRRVGSDDLTLVVTAIDIARRTGGNLTEIFEKIAETIRGRMRIEMRVMTLTAQGRLQGLIVGLMPFFLGAGMTMFKPDLMLPFIFSVGGGLILVGTTVLVGIGGLLIHKIVKIDV